MKVSRQARMMACTSFLVLLAATMVIARGSKGGYHLLQTIPLAAAPGGGEYFDYVMVDAIGRRIYVSHGTEVQVLDADTLAVVGTIAGLQRCHGVALAREVGKGFITDGAAQQVVVFDINTLKTTNTIKTFPDADSIIYDPASKLIFAFNGDSKNVSVIDPVKETVVNTIDLKGSPEFPVSDGAGMIYDNNEETNEVVAIDTHTLTIKSRWPVAPAGQPVAMAMDRKNRRLFSSSRKPQMLIMMNADTGAVLQSFPISSGVDANSFDPKSGLLFVSTREGMLHIFHEDSPDKLSVVETVTTQYGAKTMGYDPKTKKIFLSTSDFATPDPTAAQPHPNPRPKPGNFRLLVYGR